MPFDLDFYPFTGVLVILLVFLLCRPWQRRETAPATPKPSRPKREPKPFAGYTHKPECEWCDQQAQSPPPLPSAPPPCMIFTRGRHRQVDTSGHFCPDATCSYHGWIGWAISAPTVIPMDDGGDNSIAWAATVTSWRHMARCFTPSRSIPTSWYGPLRHWPTGSASAPWPGSFEVDPNTVLSWRVEAAEHLEAFSRYFLQDVHVEQVQMDELFALLSTVKQGEVTEAEAIKRLSRSPYWVWVAIDPVYKLILAVNVGHRTLALAPRLVHQVTQVLAPDCAPLLLTDGFGEYLQALVTHYGRWI